jgi:hypothetical protein
MKKVLSAMVVCGLALFAACAADEGAPSEESLELPEVEGRELVTELPSEEELAQEPIEKAGCVHVKWCNEPGEWGTICQVDNYNCTWGAAINECIRDARYVCGREVPPVGLDY